jgi:hypothetical protein
MEQQENFPACLLLQHFLGMAIIKWSSFSMKLFPFDFQLLHVGTLWHFESRHTTNTGQRHRIAHSDCLYFCFLEVRSI